MLLQPEQRVNPPVLFDHMLVGKCGSNGVCGFPYIAMICLVGAYPIMFGNLSDGGFWLLFCGFAEFVFNSVLLFNKQTIFNNIDYSPFINI